MVLDGAVLSLSLTRNNLEMIAGCSSGSVYRIASQDLVNMLCGSAHTTAISCICFGSSVGSFVTGTVGGEIRVWDIGDYAAQSVSRPTKSGAVLSVCVAEGVSGAAGGSVVISGWEDGSIRGHDMADLSRQLWLISCAHRGGTNSVAVHRSNQLEYLVSGGADGAVRIWKLTTRELTMQFGEHQKGVSKVLVDCRQFHLVHSVSADGSVLTFDIKSQRRVVGHFLSKGAHMLSMSQRLDSEQEIVTCDSLGRLLMWDCDVREPVQTLQDPAGVPLRSCAVSPSGKYLAYGGDDGYLKVLALASSEIICVGVGHSDVLNTIAWTPDERQIVSGGNDCCICVWNFFSDA